MGGDSRSHRHPNHRYHGGAIIIIIIHREVAGECGLHI